MTLLARTCLSVGLLVALGTTALAQESQDVGPGLSEAATAGFWDGGGVLVGDTLVLHPRFELGTAYQSNVFYSNGGTDANGPILSAGVARAVVGATLGTKEPGRMELEGGQGANQAVAFKADVALTWNQFISSNSAITTRSDLGINALADLTIQPQGVVTFELRDGYTRAVNPGPSISTGLDRDKNDLLALLTWKPGGGALQSYLSYTFTSDLFETGAIAAFDNRFMHTFELGARWRWLPITEFTLLTNLGIVTPNDQTYKPKSNPFRVLAGASTLITPPVGLILQAGYGNGFYASGPSVSTYLLLVELRYAIGPTVRLAAGYNHDFADALIGNSYADHKLFARFGLQIESRLQFRVKGELRFRSYDGIHDAGNVIYCGDASCGKFRKDVMTGVDATLEYQFTNWLYASLVFTLQTDSTDFFVMNGGAVDPGSFVWTETGARVSARF
ncbi:MAG TPA: hypothetical protein VKE22_10400 [Haliangiales bacterium]|nr:hypothetical protein [Haliangiales bacterium]